MARFQPTWLLLFVVLAGCAQAPAAPTTGPAPAVDCSTLAPEHHVLFLGPGMHLVPTLPATGGAAGNDFDKAFVANDLVPWVSMPLDSGLRLVGNATLDIWYSTDVAIAPAARDPQDATLLFAQLGTQRGYPGANAYETGPAALQPGERHVNLTVSFLPGGTVAERGDTIQLLLTSLLQAVGPGPATQVLFGEAHPSRITFDAVCFHDAEEWTILQDIRRPIQLLPASQGGPLGLGGQEAVNQFTEQFTILNGTQRLRVFLKSADADTVPKKDMDLRIRDASGTVVVEASTPYVNESVALWTPNLEHLLPVGSTAIIEVDSYSGYAYSGYLEVAFESAEGLP